VSANNTTNKKTETIFENDLEKARQQLKLLQRVSLKILQEADRELRLNGDLMEAFKQELQQTRNKC